MGKTLSEESIVVIKLLVIFERYIYIKWAPLDGCRQSEIMLTARLYTGHLVVSLLIKNLQLWTLEISALCAHDTAVGP